MTTEKEFKILQPKYYSKFQCDPIKCHETCCERWKIIIDKRTYEKYILSENETIKKIVKTGLSINKAAINDDNYAIINLNNEMLCPFLNQKNLCEVFINIGESSLSKTCKSYPRAITLVTDVMERGLEMSCSVAADLALLDAGGIEFEHIIDTVKLNDFYVVVPTTEDVKQIEVIKEIRTEVINLLQDRANKLSERVANVGYFLSQVIEGVDFSCLHHEEALSRIKEVKSLTNLRAFKVTRNHHQNRQQFDHLNTILSMKFEKGDSISFFSKRYVECLIQVIDAFGSVEAKGLEKYYKTNNEKYLKPYLDKKSYIIENFLVNYIFVYDIELFKSNEIWNSYLKLCVIYGLLKFNLVGLASYHKGMSDDLMLKLIQSLSKTIITDKMYLESVIKYLEEEKLVEFSKIISLIVD